MPIEPDPAFTKRLGNLRADCEAASAAAREAPNDPRAQNAKDTAITALYTASGPAKVCGQPGVIISTTILVYCTATVYYSMLTQNAYAIVQRCIMRYNASGPAKVCEQSESRSHHSALELPYMVVLQRGERRRPMTHRHKPQEPLYSIVYCTATVYYSMLAQNAYVIV